MLDSPIVKKRRHPTLKVFLMGLTMAAIIFVPFIIIDKGYFTYYGDFNVQQIPFYQVFHDAFRSGELGWNFNIDLGSNFIGNNAFYMIGSPSFWLMLLFPNDVVPKLIAPFLIIKIALCAVTAFLYLRRFLSEDYATIGGLLYAFSGFTMYNVFFNQFHECILIFPLMLLAMERLVVDNKRGMFAVVVFFSAINNYYFFIGQCVFLIIYFFFRLFSKEWKMTFPRFLQLFLEALIGTAMAAVTLLPAFLAITQNPRTESNIAGWDVLIHSSPQRFFDIIHSYFFPQALPARVSFFPDSNNRWGSMTAWIPVFAFTGVFAYFQSRKHNDWLKRLITLLIFMSLIPGLNAIFQLMKDVYYARWFYMMVLFLIMATMKCFDEGDRKPVEWGAAIKLTAFVIAFFGIIIGLTPLKKGSGESAGKFEFGLYGDVGFFFVAIAFAVVGLVLTGMLVSVYKNNSRPKFIKWCTAVVSIVAVIFGLYSIGVGKYSSYYDSKFIVETAIKGGDKIDIERTNDARVDFYDEMQNMGMFWKMPTIQAFHSVVPGSIHEFYESVGVDRYVNSNPEQSRYGLRSLLSVEWIFKQEKDTSDLDETDRVKYETAMDNIPGISFYEQQNGFDIYKNDCFIPYGFTYDKYISRSDFNRLSNTSRELAMLKAIVLEDEDVEKYSNLYGDLMNFAPIYNKSEYLTDCEERQAGAADTFTRIKNGFQSSITTDSSTLVFFSIPFEDGWSASVNGKAVDIVKSNVGFMAVPSEAGDNEIVFSYKTPGLETGIKIALSALAVLLVYLLMFTLITRSRKKRIGTRATPSTTPTADADNVPFDAIAPADDEGEFDLYEFYTASENDDTDERHDDK